MKKPGKILWYEGLNLSPQQFQRQDRYHEARLHQITAAITPHLWGVVSLEWDIDGLHDNVLRATSMQLIFQDGETYDAPNSDALPPPIRLDGLSSDDDLFTFHVAIPLLKDYGENLSADDRPEQSARYRREERDSADLFDDATLDVRLSFLYKTSRFLAPHESRDAYVNFPVVRLRRSVNGGFDIDQGFIPPGLSIGATARLPVMLESLLAKLRAKLAMLYAVHREPALHVVEVQGGDIASFWMLHTINMACAQIGHFIACQAHHPERLYLTLLGLAGGLMSFSRKYDVADMPTYQHTELGACFSALDALIRDLVDTVIPTKYFTIPLTQEVNQPSCYQGSIDTVRIDHRTRFYLAISADMPAATLASGVPNWLKVGAPGDVERMVNSALPGATLRHLVQVPTSLPVRPDTIFYELDRHSAQYENMLKAQAIRIYVPDKLSRFTLELIAVTG